MLDPSTLLPFSSSLFENGTLVLATEEHEVEYVAPRPGPGTVVLPGRAWYVVLGYNGTAHWEARR